jgi:hypothetical protein
MASQRVWRQPLYNYAAWNDQMLVVAIILHFFCWTFAEQKKWGNPSEPMKPRCPAFGSSFTRPTSLPKILNPWFYMRQQAGSKLTHDRTAVK